MIYILKNQQLLHKVDHGGAYDWKQGDKLRSHFSGLGERNCCGPYWCGSREGGRKYLDAKYILKVKLMEIVDIMINPMLRYWMIGDTIY